MTSRPATHISEAASERRSPQLKRETFIMSRELEYFTEKELRLQIGTGPELWPLALTKELFDNALDVTEGAGIPPVIEVALDQDGITVGDNGPGLPENIIAQSLNYMVRVSDKLHYVSPTRGQLGNALKCVWAAPFVKNGKLGEVTVTTRGKQYHITVALDGISQRLKIEPVITPCPEAKPGTFVKIWWGTGWLEASSEGIDFYNLNVKDTAGLLAGYALFNPHATFILHDKIKGKVRTWQPTATTFNKWRPCSSTSPHWYTNEQIEGLIGAYIGVERDGGCTRTVREFVSEFAGLSGSQRQKAVTDGCGLTGHELVRPGHRARTRPRQDCQTARHDEAGIAGRQSGCAGHHRRRAFP